MDVSQMPQLPSVPDKIAKKVIDEVGLSGLKYGKGKFEISLWPSKFSIKNCFLIQRM
jgi:hypothetical protein